MRALLHLADAWDVDWHLRKDALRSRMSLTPRHNSLDAHTEAYFPAENATAFGYKSENMLVPPIKAKTSREISV